MMNGGLGSKWDKWFLKSRLPGSSESPDRDPGSPSGGQIQAAPAMLGAARWAAPWRRRSSTGRGPQVPGPGGAPGRNRGLPWWLVLRYLPDNYLPTTAGRSQADSRPSVTTQ